MIDFNPKAFLIKRLVKN